MKILAVDDDVFILELLPVVLANSGYHDVSVRASPIRALSLLEREEPKFDCLFLDIAMPGMDGIELCRRIRALPGYKETPIIMLTVMSDISHIDRAFEAGATDYVTKPFDVTEIGARVHIAEKLIASQNGVKERQATKTSSVTKSEPVVATAFLDPQRIEDVEGAVEYEALSNYLGQLSRAGLDSSNIFAIKIDQAEEIHSKTSPLEYSFALSEVADVIAEILREKGFFLMTYAGSGHFLCVSHSSYFDSDPDAVLTLQYAIDERELAYDNGSPMDINVSVGKSLKPRVSASKGTHRIFRVAIARSEDTYNAKQGLLSRPNIRRVP